MSKPINGTVARVLGGLDNLDQITSGRFELLAEAIEISVATQGGDGLHLDHETVLSFLNRNYRSLTPETKTKVTADGSEAARLFKLGQVSFAQLILGVAARKRAPSVFQNYFENDPHRAYVRLLLSRDCTNAQIAEELRVRPETVSRKLKELRDVGITDFRRIGTNCFNFLTPSARAVAKAANHTPVDAPQSSEEVLEMVRQTKESLPPYMRARMTFSTSDQALDLIPH